MGAATRAALRVCAVGALLRSIDAQACPANSLGLGDGNPCQCDDGYTGPLSNPSDPTSGTHQLTFSGGNYLGPCSREPTQKKRRCLHPRALLRPLSCLAPRPRP